LLQSIFKLSPHYGRVRSRLHYGSDIELQYQLRSHGINTDSGPINSDGALRDDIRYDWFYEHLRTERSGISDPNVQPPSIAPNEDGPDAFSVGAKAVDFETLQHGLDHHSKALLGGNATTQASSEAKLPRAGTYEKQERSDTAENAPITPTDSDVLLGRGRFVQYNPGNIRFRKLAEKYKDEYDTAPRRRRQEIVSEVIHVLSSEGARFLKQMDTDVWVKSNDKEAKKKVTQLYREFRKQK